MKGEEGKQKKKIHLRQISRAVAAQKSERKLLEVLLRRLMVCLFIYTGETNNTRRKRKRKREMERKEREGYG